MSDVARDDALVTRLLGRRDAPVATEVLVVVDPDDPGAAELRPPGGEDAPDGRTSQVWADWVAASAVLEAGEPAGPVVREPSVTATVDRVASALRRRADVPFAVVDGATVATGTSLGDVVADPRAQAGVLRAAGGGVVAVRVPSADRAAVADEAEALLAREPRARVLDLLDDACRAAGLAPADRGDELFPVARPADAASLGTAWSTVRGLDEVGLRLRRAQRSDDGFLSTFLVRPLSRRLTPLAVRRGIAPSTVTAAALLLGLLSAVAYALAATGAATAWRVLGSLLLLASLVVDCVDGEVARSTRTFSARGAWLDVGADRVKEYAVYAGLAAGVGTGPDHLIAWWLAFAAMGLLVTRHFVDFGFGAVRPATAAGPAVTAPGTTRRRVGPAAVTGRSGGGAVEAWSERTSARPALKWAKRAVIMPVGERTLLLVVLAPLAGVQVTLVVLLALGVVAAAWTTAGRVGRTLARSPGDSSTGRLSVLAWLRPALARAVEHGLVALLVAWIAATALPGAFAWLAVVAFGLYDRVYRQRLTGVADVPRVDVSALPRASVVAETLLGWPGRVLLVLLVVSLAGTHAGTVLVVAAGLLLVALLMSSGRFWGRWVPSTP